MLSSPNDHRQYRYITLNNALRILLIKDEQASRSAAALSVNVGHFSDPPHREGLAHFLEHMLFLGTKKHPKEGGFQSFITRHGGTNNAWTGAENTTYFFDIQPAFFKKGLDRFSQFFISPLFNQDAVNKERLAVDSEYKLKVKDDIRRIYQVQKETINPHHPFAKFSVGNLSTLSDQKNHLIYDDLLEFYHTHYSANLMTLALIAPLELEALEQIARTYFSAIGNLNILPNNPKTPFVTSEQCKKYIYIEPLKETRKLSVSFSVPQYKNAYKTKPLSFIAHLLGDEGKGSLLSLLKQEGLINHLSAGGGVNGSTFKEFSVNFSLTEKGIENINTIICALFQTIKLIKTKGLAPWRYLEKKYVQEMAFRYQEPSRPLNTVSRLALNMQHYEENDILMGDYMMQAFDKASIEEMLHYLTPDKIRISLIAKDQRYDKKAQWYDTPYRVQAISEKEIHEWKNTPISKKLKLATKNPFIYNELKPFKALNNKKKKHSAIKHSELPEQITQIDGIDLWFLQDTHYLVPKGTIHLSIGSQYTVSSIENIVKTKLYIELFLDSINESTYHAQVAGLNYHCYTTQVGVNLILSGFNEKIPLLLKLLLDKFNHTNITSKRFDIIKHQLVRNWSNAQKNKPISQLHNLMLGILQPNTPPYEVLVNALKPLKLSDFHHFTKHVLFKNNITLFVHGNWQESDAIALAHQVKKQLHLDDFEKIKKIVRPLVLLDKAGSMAYHHDCNHDDSAVLVYYQSKEMTAEQTALHTFAQQLMSATFYNQLRTKQQLGYVVGSSNMPLNRHSGLIFYVQSPQVGPNSLLDAIDDFLNAFFMVLLALTESQWQMSKQGLIGKLEEPEANLSAQSQRFWSSIINQDQHFDQRKKIIDAIKKMSRADMVKFVVEKLKPRTSDRLIMHSCGNAHLGQDLPTDTIEITDIPFFRHTHLANKK